MKRLISFLLVVAMLFSLSPTVMATEELSNNKEEQFSFRNGILFGDTVDVVWEKEDKLIPDTTYGENNVFKGEIAGYKNASCIFFFEGENNGLSDIYYSFDKKSGMNSKESLMAAYEKLNESLVRQYGDPLGLTDGEFYIFHGRAIDIMLMDLGIFSMISKDNRYLDYDEWIIDFPSGKIKIDETAFYYTDYKGDKVYQLLVSYTPFNEEQLSDLNESKAAKQANIDNDL